MAINMSVKIYPTVHLDEPKTLSVIELSEKLESQWVLQIENIPTLKTIPPLSLDIRTFFSHKRKLEMKGFVLLDFLKFLKA